MIQSGEVTDIKGEKMVKNFSYGVQVFACAVGLLTLQGCFSHTEKVVPVERTTVVSPTPSSTTTTTTNEY